jgi:hypothetical protein
MKREIGMKEGAAEVRMKMAAKILETEPLSQNVSDTCHVLSDHPLKSSELIVEKGYDDLFMHFIVCATTYLRKKCQQIRLDAIS